MNKLKKVILLGSIIVILFAAFLIYWTCQFHHNGINAPLISDPAELEQDMTNSELAYQIDDNHRMTVSKMYLIENGDNVQIRFRVAYAALFGGRNLLRDMSWVIADSEENSYEGRLTLYPEKIAGIEMVCATLSMSNEEFSLLSGKELTVKVDCAEYGENENYGHCKLVINMP